MSTENVKEQAEAALAALGQLSDEAVARLKRVQAEREGFDKQRIKVVQGARLAMQRLDDQDAPLAEEENQLAGALNPDKPKPTPEPPVSEPVVETPPAPPESDTSAPLPPADLQPPEAPLVEWDELAPEASPAPTTPQPKVPPRNFRVLTEADLNKFSQESLLKLAQWYQQHLFGSLWPMLSLDLVRLTKPQLIEWIMQAQPIYCELVGISIPPTPAPAPVVHPMDVSEWNWMQWATAIVGAIFAFIVGMATRGWPDIHNAGRGVFAVAWVVGVVAVGFFLFGLLGSLIDRGGRSDDE